MGVPRSKWMEVCWLRQETGDAVKGHISLLGMFLNQFPVQIPSLAVMEHGPFLTDSGKNNLSCRDLQGRNVEDVTLPPLAMSISPRGP